MSPKVGGRLVSVSRMVTLIPVEESFTVTDMNSDVSSKVSCAVIALAV